MISKTGRLAGIFTASVASLALTIPWAAADGIGNALHDDPNYEPRVKARTVVRLAGTDRIQTAIATAESRKWSCNVIIATDKDFPDSLVAGPLADVLNAPILLNPQSSLHPDVATEISHLSTAGHCQGVKWREHVVRGMDYGNGLEPVLSRFSWDRGPGTERWDSAPWIGIKVWIVGGTGSISEGVQNAIASLPIYPSNAVGQEHISRQWGSDRFNTAIEIGKTYANIYKLNDGDGTKRADLNVFLTDGTNWPDALVAGTAAAQDQGFLLLSNGPTQDERTQNFIDTFANTGNAAPWAAAANVSEIVAVGGNAAKAYPDADKSFVGDDRYETASKLATAYFPASLANTENNTVGIVSGENWADGVVAGGYMANADGPLLLTEPGSLNAFTKGYLESHRMWMDYAFIFGGVYSVSPSVADAVADALFV